MHKAPASLESPTEVIGISGKSRPPNHSIGLITYHSSYLAATNPTVGARTISRRET